MRRIATGALALAVVVATFSSASAAPPFSASERTRDDVRLDVYGWLEMFDLARRALALPEDPAARAALPTRADVNAAGSLPTIVTIYHRDQPMIWGVGETGDVRARILAAVDAIIADDDFAGYRSIDPAQIAITMAVIDDISPIKIKGNRAPRIEPGVHGLILDMGDHRTYLPGPVFVHKGWAVEADGRSDRREKILVELGELAGTGANGWKEHPLFRFRTESALQIAEDIKPELLYRGNQAITSYTVQDLQDAATRAGQYLLRSVDDDGRFVADMDPTHDVESDDATIDPYHHAKALYAIATLVRYSGQLATLEQARTPLRWLNERIQPLFLQPELLGVNYMGNAVTTTNAMSLMALAQLPRQQLEIVGVAQVNRLAHTLVDLQDDDGSFYPSYYHRLTHLRTSAKSTSVAAHATLALARYYGVNKTAEWIIAARRGADYLIEEFERTGDADPWSLQAVAEVDLQAPDEKLESAVFAMADGIMGEQYTPEDRDYLDYTGGFKNNRPPRTLSAALRAEALIAAFKVAKKAGKPTHELAERVLMATAFLLNAQYHVGNGYYLRRPEEAYGAVRYSLIDPTIDVDEISHAMIVYCQAFDVLWERSQGPGAPDLPDDDNDTTRGDETATTETGP
ncbi:MAG: hypothetical protein H6683_02165 [Deltaproteobacteria bacterium]|nr:hypothetical protein [Deltaproteobacteria bacterium]